MPLVFLAATETVTVAIVPVNIDKLWLEPRTLAGLAGDVDIDTGVIARAIDIHIGVVIRNADFEHREIPIGFIRGGRTASNGIRQGARTDGNKEYERKRDDGGPLDASGHVPLSSKQQSEFILLPGRICDSKKSASPKTGKAPKVEMHPQAVELG